MNERPIKQPGTDHPITISPTPGRVVVTAGGRVLADSRCALTLREAGYPDVQYLPREDIDLTRLQGSEHASYCPYKGEAAYFHLLDGAANVAWSYPAPYPAVAGIRDYLAFYPDRVDAIELTPLER